MMEVVSQWWDEIDTQKKLDQPFDCVADLLVKKGISSDIDSASKVLQKYLDTVLKGAHITRDDFYQVFCKCIFKDSLIAMSEQIDAMDKGLGEMPLTLKLGHYQRDLMIKGLDQTHEDFDKGRAILNARFNISASKDLSLKTMRYASFIRDPLGSLAKQEEEERLKKRKLDSYTKGIKLTNLVSNGTVKADIEGEIEEVERLES